MTNLAQLPFLQFSITTFTNADWLDGVVFLNNNAQSCVLASINTPGTGYTSGTQVLTVVGGVGTPTQISATVIAGAVAALGSFVAPGNYSIPAAATGAPTAGGGGSGCTLNLTFSGQAIDLTGISFHSTIRTAAANPAVALDTSTTNGLLISGGTSGALSYAVPAAVMAKLAPGSYVADIVASDASGANALIAQINITHEQGVTL